MRDAVAELLCSFPVYRSYLPEGRASLDRAVDTAATARPELAEIVRTIHAGMLAEPDGALTRRVEQTSGMVTAKGVEDTTFYRWNRFVALNEVGGAPDRFGVAPAEFHARAAARDAATPATMTTLSTHDTKRSEDVRARLAVLSELTAEWGAFLRTASARHPLPSPSLELLAWQSVLGAWPITEERLAGYLTKASKEAKLVTAHVDAVPEVDEAIAAWPGQVLGDPEAVAEIEAFVARDRRARAGRTRWARSSCSSPGRASPTSTRAPSSSSTRSSTPTTGGPSTSTCAAGCSSASTAAGCRRSMATSRRARGGEARGHVRGAAPAALPPRAVHRLRAAARLRAGRRRTPSRSPAAARPVASASWRSRPGCPVGLEAPGGWRDTVLPLPGGADDWTDVSPAGPSTAPRPPWARSWTASRSRCWSARPDGFAT